MAAGSSKLVEAGLLALDREGRVVSANPAGCELLGIESGKAAGARLKDLVEGLDFPEEDVATHLSLVHVRGKKKGESRRVSCTLTSAVVGKQRVWLVALQDLSGLMKREGELIEIADLAVKRLGQELHDSVCQQLAGADLVCQALLKKLDGNKDATALAGQVREMVKAGLTQARAISHGSAISEDRTLADNLKQLVRSMMTGFPGGCQMLVHYVHEDLPQAFKTHVCRIAQEALHNASRHGQAERATVRLFGSADKMALEVEDDGAGMDARTLRRGGLGINSMRERAGLLGGELAMESTPKKGTTIHLMVPLAAPPKGREVKAKGTKIHLVIPPQNSR
ncbi:MAG: hypothetical protein CMO64_00825 [Verrucomicrobiales bacterium]|nr:hypothetical protein [Verrucomicrobiales bacterium]|tara:strand:- start:2489 stop:3502 length:1014 start_codon:yes stop_codon:yes gene_type:complete